MVKHPIIFFLIFACTISFADYPGLCTQQSSQQDCATNCEPYGHYKYKNEHCCCIPQV